MNRPCPPRKKIIGFTALWVGVLLVNIMPSPPAHADNQNPENPGVSHTLFDALLKKHVDAHGGVDYRGFARDADQLNEYIQSLANVSLQDLPREEQLALLINAYNAFTLRLILDYYPIGSIKDIPESKRWDHQRWRIGPHTWSLNQIEHEQIRPKFQDARVHFALVCAAVGCPPLRHQAYVAGCLQEQLEDQSRYVHTHRRWFRYDSDGKTLYLTKLYDWYGGDFEQEAGAVLQFVARYSPRLKRALDHGQPPRVRWLDYEWTLNDQEVPQ